MKMFGKFPAIDDGRNLKLINYTTPLIPEVPEVVDWYSCRPFDQWGTGGNLTHGDCVACHMAHAVEASWCSESKRLDLIPDSKIINAAIAMDGLEGMAMLTALKYWHNTGLWGTKTLGFVEVDKTKEQIKLGVQIFGHVSLGFYFPRAWDTADVWKLGLGSEYRIEYNRGHAVVILGYDLLGVWVCSWGRMYHMSWEALFVFMDEVYVSVLPDWYALDQMTPSGIAADKLLDDFILVSA